ncbi:hypothetical protein M3G03_07145 [Aestuariimicrobium sp. p3-SID1156]|uniref:hypothetical protein n=1 Tax=Aestuariimicrobium sp. p3-SID1156 TaxID=2916038 RepID=UPI00223ACF66|nr:hypothetical protein [Aestuariimicrobium sp. p3-SID1156]MCT1459317.1 hypothetical protein [Aestuariimicrobium sp. p3-SID1156]
MNTYRFLDPGTILHHWCSGMVLRPGPVRKDERAPLLEEELFATPSRPYEPRIDNGYPNVIHDQRAGVYRLYYTEFVVDEVSAATPLADRAHMDYVPAVGRRVALAYAESTDGIKWEKPNLGIVELDGTTDNNILIMDAHGAGVMLDERDPDPARRYKVVTRIDHPGGGHHLAAGYSADGLHFGELVPWPEHRPLADTHNVVFWDEEFQRYAVITRIWVDALRVQALSTSTDFIHWTEPEPCARGVDAWHQLYSFPVMRLDDLWIGFGSIYHDGDRLREDWDTVDLSLMCARDLRHWQFPMAYRPFLPRGEGAYPDGAFDAACLYAAAPVQVGTRWWLYYFGSNGRHTGFRETALGRAEVDLDRLAGYEPTGSEGTLSIGPFRVLGPDLELHADVNPGGVIDVEVIDLLTRERVATGSSLTGSGWQDLPIHWPAGLPDRQVTIVLRCRDSTVFGVRGELVLHSSDLILHES